MKQKQQHIIVKFLQKIRKKREEILKIFRRGKQIYKVLDFLILTLETKRQRTIIHDLEFYTQPNQ